jgi:hypothetical protein
MFAPNLEAVSPIVRESDLTVPLKEMAVAQPGVFTITDVFEIDDDATFEDALAMGLSRMGERAETERFMALHYYWHANQLSRLAVGGTLANTEPAPLTVEELTESLSQLANHPDYRGQTIRSIAHDWTFVVLADGEVTTEASP